MEVTLDAYQEALVQAAVRSGRLRNPEMPFSKEWLSGKNKNVAVLDSAEASFSRSEGRTISSYDGTRQLAEDVKRRGRTRLAARIA